MTLTKLAVRVAFGLAMWAAIIWALAEVIA